MIMISYARSDVAVVSELVDDLERAREDVWIDRELAGGQAWWDTILDVVRRCDVLVVALSPSFLDSRACRAELDYAVRLGRRIMPVMVKDVAVQLAPPVIVDAQIVDYRTRSIESAIALVSAIKDQSPPPPLPTPLPDPPKPPISYMSAFNERVDADTLTYTDQIHLVAELKAFLHRSSDHTVAVQLLRRLRRRPDITESVGRELDEVLEALAVDDKTPEEATPPHHIEPSATGARRTMIVTDPQANEENPTSSAGDSHPHRRSMILLFAAVGAIVAIAVGAALLLRDPPAIVAKDENGLPIADPLAQSQLIVPMQVDDGNWALFVADAASRSRGRMLTPDTGFVGGPVLSRNRRTVIYLQDDDIAKSVKPRSLRVTSVGGSGDRKLFTLPDGCDRPVRPAWNPADAAEIALICLSDDGEYVMRIMSIDGREIRVLPAPKGKPKMLDPAYSADGKTLGFWAGPADGGEGGTLYTVPTTGGTPKPLLAPNDANGRDRDMVFSPDGEHVAFVRRPESGDAGDQILLARKDGKRVVSLTEDTRYDHINPTWSPDSQQLAYNSNKPVSSGSNDKMIRVWTMTAEGNDESVLWTGPDNRQQAAASWTAR